MTPKETKPKMPKKVKMEKFIGFRKFLVRLKNNLVGIEKPLLILSNK